MELTLTLSYILLAVAAVALVVFVVTWSRRSKPTGAQPDQQPHRGAAERNERDSP